MTGRQLRAETEVLIASSTRTQLESELPSYDAEEDDSCKPCERNEKRKRNPDKQRKWGKHSLCNSLPHFPEGDCSKYREISPYELLKLYFDEDLFDMILAEIQIYALLSKKLDSAVSKTELKMFIAILILCGYNWLPEKMFY